MDLVVTINDRMTANQAMETPNDFNDVQDVVLQRFVGIDASIFMPSKWGKPSGGQVSMAGWEVEVNLKGKPFPFIILEWDVWREIFPKRIQVKGLTPFLGVGGVEKSDVFFGGEKWGPGPLVKSLKLVGWILSIHLG